jgi:hypothetical protein
LLNNLVDFTWEVVPSAGSYKIQIATNPNFTLASIQQEIDSINATSISIKLTANKKHFWRVASEVNGIPGSYSASRTVTTGAAVGVNVEQANAISIYPNPVLENGLLDIGLLDKGQLNFPYSITDINGRVVLEGKTNGNRIDVSKLPAGTYFLKTNSGVGNFIKQ